MAKRSIPGGVVHDLPDDLQKVLSSDSQALAAWENITPLARNEWICWVTIVKKAETRKEHVKRMVKKLKEGMRRPCCWPGCPHRRTKAKKWFRKGAAESSA
jgi:hypothetical protein